MMQRLFDILLSTAALIVLLPLLLPMAFLLRMTGEGEVFFSQIRVGKGGQAFNLYKFATMLKDSPNLLTGTITTNNDPRILPLGRFLRRTKINELPQLLNILKGDMSIIGPRPQTLRCFQAFAPTSQQAIAQVRPGLSGIGSIIFRREESLMHGRLDSVRFYDEVISPYKGVLEEWYVANEGLRTYFLCIGVTACVLLNSESDVAWRVFGSLPRPPDEIASMLHWPCSV
jgi:lipopolysaccharide/colanic/teichoic acid biosynthesis glycosyltransferase